MTIVAVEKQGVLHILSVSVALVIQYTMHMRHIVICGQFGCTVFSTLPHKRHEFSETKLLSIKHVFFFISSANFCLKHLSL